MPEYLDTDELAARWNLSAKTLRNWRALGTGPDYVKIGVRVLYSRAAVEAFEAAGRRVAA